MKTVILILLTLNLNFVYATYSLKNPLYIVFLPLISYSVLSAFTVILFRYFIAIITYLKILLKMLICPNWRLCYFLVVKILCLVFVWSPLASFSNSDSSISNALLNSFILFAQARYYQWIKYNTLMSYGLEREFNPYKINFYMPSIKCFISWRHYYMKLK